MNKIEEIFSNNISIWNSNFPFFLFNSKEKHLISFTSRIKNYIQIYFRNYNKNIKSKPVLLSILLNFRFELFIPNFDRATRIGTTGQMQINLLKFTFQIFDENREKKKRKHSFRNSTEEKSLVFEISCESKLPSRRNFIHI